uniref:Uncharacterized protein n=1 Tax=Chromera velia CCMP2878 TaxID=1169474 RepID=A0A0G4HBZ9_9ALVE|eukprot:Cvel_26083.t1-p1 / transcript=Cvel_26083.t1 / gene=Cvel_26083 / organism=Chromera_velia_CCMP2878 / gene_product=hypothetical protein / transcript_product=hypothetical protein / location=Cvel_scaffold3046:14015-17949(+) / protein_length=343 / sequence_SO=supercontig / SO=protein_coding / is_pseudo=false
MMPLPPKDTLKLWNVSGGAYRTKEAEDTLYERISCRRGEREGEGQEAESRLPAERPLAFVVCLLGVYGSMNVGCICRMASVCGCEKVILIGAGKLDECSLVDAERWMCVERLDAPIQDDEKGADTQDQCDKGDTSAGVSMKVPARHEKERRDGSDKRELVERVCADVTDPEGASRNVPRSSPPLEGGQTSSSSFSSSSSSSSVSELFWEKMREERLWPIPIETGGASLSLVEGEETREWEQILGPIFSQGLRPCLCLGGEGEGIPSWLRPGNGREEVAEAEEFGEGGQLKKETCIHETGKEDRLPVQFISIPMSSTRSVASLNVSAAAAIAILEVNQMIHMNK